MIPEAEIETILIAMQEHDMLNDPELEKACTLVNAWLTYEVEKEGMKNAMQRQYDADRARVLAFLDAQRTRFTQEQWDKSYPSWMLGGSGWNIGYNMGGTYIVAALTWYQHIFKPGSKEWRPTVIMTSIFYEARKAAK